MSFRLTSWKLQGTDKLFEEVLGISGSLLNSHGRLEPEAEQSPLLGVLPAVDVDEEHPELEAEVAGLLLAPLLHLLVDHDPLVLAS